MPMDAMHFAASASSASLVSQVKSEEETLHFEARENLPERPGPAPKESRQAKPGNQPPSSDQLRGASGGGPGRHLRSFAELFGFAVCGSEAQAAGHGEVALGRSMKQGTSAVCIQRVHKGAGLQARSIHRVSLMTKSARR